MSSGAPHRLSFAPLAFETHGTPTRDFLNLFGELCSRRAELGGFDPSEEAVYRHYCRSRLSSALQAANARQLHHLAADAPAVRCVAARALGELNARAR